MEGCVGGIQEKMSKIENSLLHLSNEIKTAAVRLFEINNSFNKVVKKLYNFSDTEIFLKEYMNLNSSILKYLSFLSEMNCKLEMLDLSERSNNNSPLSNKNASMKVFESQDLSFVIETLTNKNDFKFDNELKQPNELNTSFVKSVKKNEELISSEETVSKSSQNKHSVGETSNNKPEILESPKVQGRNLLITNKRQGVLEPHKSKGKNTKKSKNSPIKNSHTKNKTTVVKTEIKSVVKSSSNEKSLLNKNSNPSCTVKTDSNFSSNEHFLLNPKLLSHSDLEKNVKTKSNDISCKHDSKSENLNSKIDSSVKLKNNWFDNDDSDCTSETETDLTNKNFESEINTDTKITSELSSLCTKTPELNVSSSTVPDTKISCIIDQDKSATEFIKPSNSSSVPKKSKQYSSSDKEAVSSLFVKSEISSKQNSLPRNLHHLSDENNFCGNFELLPNHLNEMNNKKDDLESNIDDSSCNPNNTHDFYSEDVSKCKNSNAEVNSDDIIKHPHINRQTGEEYDVVIESIKSPSEFYVSFSYIKQSFLSELELKLKLISKIKSSPINSKYKKAKLKEQLGSYALFYSKCEEIWCRAKITDWGLNFNDDFVNIFLLDYGESRCVSMDDLQAMPESFKKYPACVQRCHLSGIMPVEMHKIKKPFRWERDASEKMESLTENCRNVKIRIAEEDNVHLKSSLPVILFLENDRNNSMNDILVECNCAKKISCINDCSKTTVITENCKNSDYTLNNWNPMKEDFESYKNNYDLDINDPAAFIYGYVGKDYERICLQFAKTNYCYKGNSCKKEHIKLDPLGFTTDIEEVYNNAFNFLPAPPLNSVLNVQITCIFNCNEFFCIARHQISYSDEENLKSLLNFMNKPENVREMKKLLIPPSAGQIVIAKFSEDRSWYRARILESQPENDCYSVEFVDYGNKETLPLSKIRAIEERYLHLPFQAMHCFVCGISRSPDVPVEVVVDFLHNRIDDGFISIKVLSRLPGEGINLLVHVYDRNGCDIGSELIERHYAIMKEEIIISEENEIIPG